MNWSRPTKVLAIGLLGVVIGLAVSATPDLPDGVYTLGAILFIGSFIAAVVSGIVVATGASRRRGDERRTSQLAAHEWRLASTPMVHAVDAQGRPMFLPDGRPYLVQADLSGDGKQQHGATPDSPGD